MSKNMKIHDPFDFNNSVLRPTKQNEIRHENGKDIINDVDFTKSLKTVNKLTSSAKKEREKKKKQKEQKNKPDNNDKPKI